MNNIYNYMHRTLWILMGIIISLFSFSGCSDLIEENLYDSDILGNLPANTPVSVNAGITRASYDQQYAFNEIHEAHQAQYTLYMPGANGDVEYNQEHSCLEEFVSSVDLQVYDFNLSTGRDENGAAKVVSRWTQLEVKKENSHDLLIAATRLQLDENGLNPVLDYNLMHAGTKISVYLRETNTGATTPLFRYRDGLSAEIKHQTSSADYFINNKRLIDLAAANTTDPEDNLIQLPQLCTYKNGNDYETTPLKIPVWQDGTESIKKDNNEVLIFSAILPATPKYTINKENGTVEAIQNPGFTDEEYLSVTIEDKYVTGSSINAGGTYKIKLKDIDLSIDYDEREKLTSLEPGMHLKITLYIDYNNKIQASAAFCKWDEAFAEGNLYGDSAYLQPYTVSEDGKTYTVYQPNGLLAWAKALNDSQSKDINLVLEQNISLPEMIQGKSNWELVGINKDTPYIGKIDGKGHTIENLIITNQGDGNYGFIPVLGANGEIKDLTIKNIKLTNEVNAYYFAGALAACNYGTITNCNSQGNMNNQTQYFYIGGITGENYGIVKDCTNSASITSFVSGGIAITNYGNIINCQNKGTVNSSTSSAGIAVFNEGYIFGCSNSSIVRGTSVSDGVGGIAGNNIKDIVGCANNGNVAFVSGSGMLGSLAGRNAGKVVSSWSSEGNNLVGENYSSSNASPAGSTVECYYFASPQDYFGDMVNELNKAIKQYNQYNGENSDFPYLWKFIDSKWMQLVDYNEELIKPDYLISDDGKTMTVYTYAGLYEWERRVNSQAGESLASPKIGNLNLILGNDIRLPDPKEGEGNWTPVCYQPNGESRERHYTGKIDGQGYKITGMKILRQKNTIGNENSTLGFVSMLGTDGNISNIVFENANVTGTSSVGIVAGEIQNGTIEGCLITGSSSVTGSTNVGGIVGVVGNNNPNLNLTNSKVIACGSTAAIVSGNNSTTAKGSSYGCWSTDSNDLGNNYGTRSGVANGDVSTINNAIIDMNNTLESVNSQWRWTAGANNSLPVLTKQN